MNAAASLFLTLLVRVTRCFILCPYCDPNHMAYPNLEEAMRGYDVPMGNPNPGHGMADPGIRNQIFSPMIKNEDAHYQLDTTFVTANHQIKCDATWSSNVYDNYRQYVDGKTKASTTGFGIEVGPSMQAEVGQDALLSGKSRLGASMSFPPLFSRSWSSSDDVASVQDFFTTEHGSIVTTEAICLTNKVDVSLYSKKAFVDPFKDAVRALHLASDNAGQRLIEFKRFVNEFGTHYASTSEMGTKISIERRYSSAERGSTDKSDLKNCNTLAGAKVFGLQMEESSFLCKNKDLISNEFQSNTVERMIVTTHGSFIANSLAEWSKQVIGLVQAETFSPRVIRRELASILHLFEDKNFEDVLVGQTPVNVTYIRQWMEPLMEDYCNIFELKSCNKTGCGIDDNCTVEQWCVNQEESFYCIDKNATLMLGNGREFYGQVDLDMIPNGHGVEYYPSGKVMYVGGFRNGQRHGLGTFYYESGQVGYYGNFKENFMDGTGLLYYQDSNTLLFNGTLQQGDFQNGRFYFPNGSLYEEV